MKVVICDDDRVYIEEMCWILEGFEGVDITTFTNSEELINNNDIFDIAFIDVEMDSYDGFDVSKSLYARNHDCIMVFFSNHSEYAVKGYKFNIFRYMLKYEPEIIKKETVAECIEEYYRRNATLPVFYKGSCHNIFVSSILYIESQSKVMKIYTENEVYETSTSLNELDKRLKDYKFVRCHKSYIVNIGFIAGMDDKYIEMQDGKTIPIGRVYKNETKFAYVKYR